MKEKIWTGEFIGVAAANLFYFMSQYILIAALPVFIMDDLGGGEWEAGMAMTCYQAGTVLFRPMAGFLINSMNKQKLLLYASLLFLILMGSLYFATSVPFIWGIRFFHGVAFAIGSTAAATLAALVLPGRRKGEGIGYFALSTNLAMVIGPTAGLLIINHLGPKILFLFLTLLAAGALVGGNGRKVDDTIALPSPDGKKGFHLSDLVEMKAMPMVILGGLVFFAYGGVLTYIPMYTKSLHLFDYTSLFFITFAMVIVMTRPWIGHLFDQKGPDYTVYPGFAFFILGFFLFSQAESVTFLLLSGAVLGIGFGALAPAFQTLAIQSVPPSRAGVATSTYFWSLDIAVGLAAVILGMVSESMSYPFMYGIVCLGSAVLGLMYYVWWRRG